MCSGRNGKASDFLKPEAEIFSKRMVALGIPPEKIILEPNSRNTGENVLFTKQLLKGKNIIIKKIIAVQKPYMERRTFATIKKLWPEFESVVTSPLISYEEYFHDMDYKNRFLNVMIGDLLRIEKYPKLGFQIEQKIPENVWRAGTKNL